MRMDEIQERIIKIVGDHLDPVEPVTIRSSLEGLGADSLDNVEIAMAVEEEFDIEISDAEAALALTVSGIIDLVARKTGVTT